VEHREVMLPLALEVGVTLEKRGRTKLQSATGVMIKRASFGIRHSFSVPPKGKYTKKQKKENSVALSSQANYTD
jgi:hypothetical protein